MECKICGKEIEKTVHNKMYCSQNCGVIAWKRRNPEAMAKIQRRFRINSREKYNAVIRRYRATPKGNKIFNEVNRKSYNSIQGKERNRMYKKWRKENLLFIPIMNNPYPQDIQVDWHHINNLFVIPMPRKLHQFSKNPITKHREISINILERLGFEEVRCFL